MSSKLFVVAKYTFVEIYKSKIMVNIIASGFFLAVVCYIVSEFSYGNPSKIALDVGLGLLSITTKVLAVFFGATLLKKEIESRTIYLILSNPISRVEFLAGKILGLSLILILNTVILSIFTTSFYYFWDGVWTSLILWSMLQIFLESLIVLLMVVCFSLFTNVNLSVFYSVGLYIAGSTIASVLETNYVKSFAPLEKTIKLFSFLIPDFSFFNVKSFILYQHTVDVKYLLSSVGYGLFYSAMLFFISALILARKDLN